MYQQLIAATLARVTSLNAAATNEDWRLALLLVRHLEWAFEELQLEKEKEVNEP